MRIKMILLTAAITATAAGSFVGCESNHPLDERTSPPRAKLGEDPIEVTHEPTPVNVGPMVNDQPVGEAPPSVPGTQDIITGTWTFTTPATTTRVERKTADLQQFSIYAGRPTPTQTPFVVITVAPNEGDKGSQAEAETNRFKITNTRTYTLNGAIAKEWTGRTTDGSAFCELLLTRPGGGGDVCHAMAIASDATQRKEALDILGSITWQATGAPAAE